MPRFFGIMDAVDILKVDFRKPESSLRNIVSVAHSFDKEVAAYHLDTQEALDLARELKCQYYQGSVVAKREKSRIHRVDHMQSNFFQLMIAVTRDEPDIDEIAKIISRACHPGLLADEAGQFRLLCPAQPGQVGTAGSGDPRSGTAQAVDLSAQLPGGKCRPAGGALSRPPSSGRTSAWSWQNWCRICPLHRPKPI